MTVEQFQGWCAIGVIALLVLGLLLQIAVNIQEFCWWWADRKDKRK